MHSATFHIGRFCGQLVDKCIKIESIGALTGCGITMHCNWVVTFFSRSFCIWSTLFRRSFWNCEYFFKSTLKFYATMLSENRYSYKKKYTIQYQNDKIESCTIKNIYLDIYCVIVEWIISFSILPSLLLKCPQVLF